MSRRSACWIRLRPGHCGSLRRRFVCAARAWWVVGIQPDVAFAMAQLGLSLDDTLTALDLEDGLALLYQPPADELGL